MSSPYRLHDSLGYQLSLAARIQQRRLEDGLRKLGLPRTFWAILLAVGNEELRQPSEIANYVGIDRTAVSRALRNMEVAGLIARQDGNGDGRTRTVAVTETGYELLAQATPIARSNAAVMAERLSPEERQDLKDLLKKLMTGEDLPPTHL
ncbi:MarR family winged helix-turn-helix transcriptional regulator [Pseudoruegeria sp. HB172150]|uniref:MarR family winged helix-turn-helix transcriptional regulator n=1 Tax=Pseudoruegeria sp. HB172150 TaxID=2721164 RepID=UPI0020A646A3|nr:MarR family transcriptional regulator [Pseudoruegeria sp. HB172150]